MALRLIFEGLSTLAAKKVQTGMRQQYYVSLKITLGDIIIIPPDSGKR
jgi:hypothetical protein